MLQSLLKYEIANNSRVTVIATSQSQATLHPSLVSSRGVHFVQKTLDIGTPCKVRPTKEVPLIIVIIIFFYIGAFFFRVGITFGILYEFEKEK